MGWEFTVLNAIQAHGVTPAGDALMPLISAIGNVGAIWVVLALVLIATRRGRFDGVAIVIALAFVVCSVMLKPMVARTRPCDINTAVKLLVARPHDFSFPSGYTCAGFAAVAALYGMGNRLW